MAVRRLFIAVVLTLLVPVANCTLATDVDRSKIPDDTDAAGVAGSGGTAGSGSGGTAGSAGTAGSGGTAGGSAGTSGTGGDMDAADDAPMTTLPSRIEYMIDDDGFDEGWGDYGY